MSKAILVITGQLMVRATTKIQQTEVFLYDISIPPQGRERKPKTLYLSTFSTTIDAEMAQALKAKERVTLICEANGQPNQGANATGGVNRIKPVHVTRAAAYEVCISCHVPSHAFEQVVTIYPNHIELNCPRCGYAQPVNI